MRASLLLLLGCLLFVRLAAAQEPKPELADFYAPEVIQDIQLEVTSANLERLAGSLPERVYVPARFRWRGQVIERVGLRYKGNSSSRPNQRHKRGFLVKFSEFVKGQRFLGLRRVALDNGVQFGSLFSERIITDILAEVGVSASRTNYARVTLNGKFIGVYVNVERIDKAFLSNRLDDAGGALFKVHTGGPGADLRYIGEDPLSYAKAFEIKAGEPAVQMSDLVGFIREVRDIPDKDFAVKLRRVFDVDAFTWQMGVLLLAGAFDQYTGLGPHNYYLHRETKTGRWRYLTWDLDVGFADQAFGRVPVIDGWHAAWPVFKGPRPLLERIEANEELLGLYRERAKRLLETHFHPEKLSARLDLLYALIRKDLERDPYPKGRVTNPSDLSFDDVVVSMKKFFNRRYETAREQLARPGNKPQARKNTRAAPGAGRGGPRPGKASADAPSELAAVRQEGGTIRFTWEDNSTGEIAFILQRCEGVDCVNFRNYKPFHGENKTSSPRIRIEPGKIVRYRLYAVQPTPKGLAGTGVSNVVTVRAGK
jgi:spore coat protein H